MSRFVQKKTKPVLPFYLAGAALLVCGLLLPMYKLGGLLAGVVAAAVVYFVSARLCPDRVHSVEVGFHTGVDDVDEMLKGIEENLNALHTLNEQISDGPLSDSMTRMEKAGRSIVAQVEKTPEKAKLIRRFANYYLPDSVKILATYANLDKMGARGQNSDAVRADVRKNAQTIATAFENQLDALYSAEALDISTDLEVLDSLLQGQGLTHTDEVLK